jgi:predicted nuclease of predicted toxin-antitoxin system
MRFLVDECCPRIVVDDLRAAGHDVLYAAESLHRSADTDLLALAVAETRIVVTEDFDFADLVFRDLLAAFGIVILYLPGSDPADRSQRLMSALTRPSMTWPGRVTIVEAKRIRQRPFP